MIKRLLFTLLVAALPVLPSTVYRESVSGDLSNSGLAPTILPVSVGSNQIFGTTGRGASGVDRDYFSVSIPAGFEISNVVELAGTEVGDAVSFFGIQAGPQVTLPVTATTADGLLGWDHYGPVTTDVNILPSVGIAKQGSTGFTGSLPAGQYAFWIQDFAPGTFAYAFDVQVTPTPEPASFGCIGLAMFSLAALRMRRKGNRA
jgi:hypothetical protein